MKTVGLLGGMSWESTAHYYKAINEGVKSALGGLNSAKICLFSVNFSEIEKLQHQGKWDETAVLLTEAAKSVEASGADFLLICTNTMHKVAPQISDKLSIPIVHIADVTAAQLQRDGITKVGLLGTAFTMQQDFYKGRLSDNFSIEVVTPNSAQQEVVHDIIYNELCKGEVKMASKALYIDIINDLQQQGAQAVILGCTEIALLVQQSDTPVALYDTTQIHAKAAVKLALEQ